MKKFFLPNGTITEFDGDLDLYNHYAVEFTPEQYAFALANPTATVNEIKVCQMYTPPVENLDDLKAKKLAELDKFYSDFSAANFDVVASGFITNGFEAGLPKCSALMMWTFNYYNEKSTTENEIKNATTTNDLYAITFKNPINKPFTVYEASTEYAEYITNKNNQ